MIDATDWSSDAHINALLQASVPRLRSASSLMLVDERANAQTRALSLRSYKNSHSSAQKLKTFLTNTADHGSGSKSLLPSTSRPRLGRPRRLCRTDDLETPRQSIVREDRTPTPDLTDATEP